MEKSSFFIIMNKLLLTGQTFIVKKGRHVGDLEGVILLLLASSMKAERTKLHS
jgi:hypothetical protein